MMAEVVARCQVCNRLLPASAFPINRGAYRRRQCRACHRGRMRPYWVAYRAAHHERLHRQAYQRARRTEYRPNRRLIRVIAQAHQQAQARDTRVGHTALLRAIFAIPEDCAVLE